MGLRHVVVMETYMCCIVQQYDDNVDGWAGYDLKSHVHIHQGNMYVPHNEIVHVTKA